MTVQDNPESTPDPDGHQGILAFAGSLALGQAASPSSLLHFVDTYVVGLIYAKSAPPPATPARPQCLAVSPQKAQQQNEQAREAHSDRLILGQFEKVFGQAATGAHLGAHNGHENEEITTTDTSGFESKFKGHEVHTPDNTARFDVRVNGRSYNLHVEFPKRSPKAGTVSVKVHFDVGNPGRDLVGAVRHLVIDVGVGKAEYPNSAGLDPH